MVSCGLFSKNDSVNYPALSCDLSLVTSFRDVNRSWRNNLVFKNQQSYSWDRNPNEFFFFFLFSNYGVFYQKILIPALWWLSSKRFTNRSSFILMTLSFHGLQVLAHLLCREGHLLLWLCLNFFACDGSQVFISVVLNWCFVAAVSPSFHVISRRLF